MADCKSLSPLELDGPPSRSVWRVVASSDHGTVDLTVSAFSGDPGLPPTADVQRYESLTATARLSSEEARTLAQALLEHADHADENNEVFREAIGLPRR